MNRHAATLALASLLVFTPALAQQPGAAADPAPGGAAAEPMDLGGGRYRLGSIELDRKAKRFSVPGRVLPVDTEAMPIEFLAVSRGGMKAYEAAIELDTDAVSFNLACILLGLDAANATLPKYHFDPAEVRGDAVGLTVTWGEGDARQTHDLIELILADGEPAASGWAYVGSGFGANGAYLAQEYGTLIGVVHDPESIIQHRLGLGLGDYGAVTVNPGLMPPAGTRVIVTLSVPD